MESITQMVIERSDRIDEFRETHKSLIEEYDRLVTEYEQAACLLGRTV